MVERTRRDTVDVNRNVTNVLVGCNLPNGLELQLYTMRDGTEMSPMGPKATKVAVKHGPPVKLHGVARRFGDTPDYPMANGYAVTTVDADFWEKWCQQNADADTLANRCLVAGADLADIQSITREAKQDKVKSGMAPLDPKNPPSVGGLKIQPATTS